MQYHVSYDRPHRHLIDITLTIHDVREDPLELQLPAWRPGRYQLENFARNIKWLEVEDGQGKPLEHHKVSKDRWWVRTEKVEEVCVRYQYYANVMDAGSSVLNEDQLYVNPVNCFLYVPGREEDPCTIELDVPEDYRIATSMSTTGPFSFEVNDLQELMDSPFIASSSLLRDSFELDGVTFHLWFQGECRPDLDRIKSDLRKIAEVQVNAFGGFPVDEYHFFYQVLPYTTRHGVEHVRSTVIVMGPSFAVLDPEQQYDSFIAISSHELYHAWNVKQIRPVEMMPYDLSGENYSRLGYMLEGVTTYMGDHMLLRSGVWNEQTYFNRFAQMLKRHFDNAGRKNLSVAASSFDTWLDGYQAGVPHRKVSIYNEGALIAFMLDVSILESTLGERSLDDLMKSVYEDHARKGKGYTEEDLLRILEEVSGTDHTPFFRRFVWGIEDYRSQLKACFDTLNIEWEETPSPFFHEGHYGFKATQEGEGWKVTSVLPGSSADQGTLAPGDKIITVNGYSTAEALGEWLAYFGPEHPVETGILREGKWITLTLEGTNDIFYRQFSVQRNEPRTSLFAAWKREQGS